jgi:hypothetical protein
MEQLDIKQMSIEEKALWVMQEYEKQEVRDSYTRTEHKNLSTHKELSAFFWWLVYQVCTSKNENGLVITEVNRLRAEQKLILEGARKHEQELCAGIPEEDL